MRHIDSCVHYSLPCHWLFSGNGRKHLWWCKQFTSSEMSSAASGKQADAHSCHHVQTKFSWQAVSHDRPVDSKTAVTVVCPCTWNIQLARLGRAQMTLTVVMTLACSVSTGKVRPYHVDICTPSWPSWKDYAVINHHHHIRLLDRMTERICKYT